MAALNFPANPVNGQTYTFAGRTWVYSTDEGAWQSTSNLGGVLSVAGKTGDVTLAAGDIPTLAAAKISDFDSQVRTSRLDQMAAPTTSVSLNSQKIVSVANPTDSSDAATKGYVDAIKQGLSIKDAARVATTSNITLSGTQTIDGVAVIAGDRVLVKDQNTASQNGVYVVASGSWSRATDFDADADVTSGAFVFVKEGTAGADNGYVLTTNDPITVGTTNLTFTQFSGAGQVTAGDGLTKTGNTINAVGTANRITVNADSIDIASTYAGQSSITTVGTLGSLAVSGAATLGSLQLNGSFYQNGVLVTLTSQDYGLITGVVDNFADYGSLN